MIKKLGIGVNILVSFIWFFNYYLFATNICLIIAILQILLAAFLLTERLRTDRIR